MLTAVSSRNDYVMHCMYRITKNLGSGQSGVVSKGIWRSPAGAMDVAVKQLQPGASELQEAAINGQFRHPNVVQLMGIVTVGEPVSCFILNVCLIITFAICYGQ